jgi:hypothetical protein
MSDVEPIRIEVAELRRVAMVLLNHLEEMVGPSISIDMDYFWVVDQAERYNPYEEPTNFSLGQLSECLTNLQAIDETNAVSFGLVWLSSLLVAAGEGIVT